MDSIEAKQAAARYRGTAKQFGSPFSACGEKACIGVKRGCQTCAEVMKIAKAAPAAPASSELFAFGEVMS